MSLKLKKLLISGSITLVLGAFIGSLLFHYSDRFFDIKTLQTQVSGGYIGSTGLNKSSSQVIPRGSVVPEIEGSYLLKEGAFKLSDLKGKVVVLNFWASWCEPCLDEFPSFAELLKKLGPQVVFVGVSQDSDKEDALSFLKAFKAELEGIDTYFIHDSKKAYAKQYGVLALPETFILDPDSKLIHRVSGFENWNSKVAVTFFEEIKKKHFGQGT